MFASMARLDPGIQQAYLARLGVEAAPPSVEALHRLVQRHAERVPYETLWIPAGEAWTIDPYESAARIALHCRGGYCYHMNGALGLLLSSLGYAVRGHVGGVHGPDGPQPAAMGNHLVLTVEALPSDTNPGGVWYVDNGLGDALHGPLPLVAGQHDQPPFVLHLEQAAERSQWHLTHDPCGGFTGVTWTTADARPADFELRADRFSPRAGRSCCSKRAGCRGAVGSTAARIERSRYGPTTVPVREWAAREQAADADPVRRRGCGRSWRTGTAAGPTSSSTTAIPTTASTTRGRALRTPGGSLPPACHPPGASRERRVVTTSTPL